MVALQNQKLQNVLRHHFNGIQCQIIKAMLKSFSVSYGEFMDKHKEACNCKSIYITMFNVIDALGNMKCGKSSDKANISAEHLHYAPLNFLK